MTGCWFVIDEDKLVLFVVYPSSISTEPNVHCPLLGDLIMNYYMSLYLSANWLAETWYLAREGSELLRARRYKIPSFLCHKVSQKDVWGWEINTHLVDDLMLCLLIWPTLFIQESTNGLASSRVGSWVAFYFGIDCQSMIMWMTGYDELIIMCPGILGNICCQLGL